MLFSKGIAVVVSSILICDKPLFITHAKREVEEANLLPCDLLSFFHLYSLLLIELGSFSYSRNWCKDAYGVKD